MALPQITTTIDPPLVSDTPEQFNAKAFAAWLQLAQLAPQVNAWSIQVDSAGVVTLQAKADAQAAATSATASKDAAAASADSASGSATSATASKDAAAASASAAASSASAASGSKDAAAASATTASNAATSATASKDAAAASASAAASSASAASGSKDAAAASATTASNAATSATASKDAAAASASAAAASASAASTSKDAAAASATTASNAATSATASKDAAAASASAAAASAASIAGGPVASVNGDTGAVTLKTVEGVQLNGTGNIVVDVAAKVHAATDKSTPVDADVLGLIDSAASWALKRLTFANLKAWIASLFVSRTSAQIDGNLNITGTGRRITGDFSNAAVANRTVFQTNEVNRATDLTIVPNGTATYAAVSARSSDSANVSVAALAVNGSSGAVELVSSAGGTGAYLPLRVLVGNAERLRINTSGELVANGSISCPYVNVTSAAAGFDFLNPAATGENSIRWIDSNGYVGHISQYSSAHATLPYVMTLNNGGGYRWNIYGIERLRIDGAGNVLAMSGALGYGVGAGGTVTQEINKDKPVVLNKPSGRITMHNSTLNANALVVFILNNSLLHVGDGLLLSIASGAQYGSYVCGVAFVDNGLAVIYLKNISNSNLSEEVGINFQVIKGAIS